MSGLASVLFSWAGSRTLKGEYGLFEHRLRCYSCRTCIQSSRPLHRGRASWQTVKLGSDPILKGRKVLLWQPHLGCMAATCRLACAISGATQIV